MPPRSLSVLMISLGLPPVRGGIERTAGELARHLPDVRLTVVAGRAGADAGDGMVQPPGIDIRWARNDPPYGRKATAALLTLAARTGLRMRPDVVLCLHIRTAPAARLIARLTGARVVLVVHAKEMREQPHLARAATRWADAIVAVSRYGRELARLSGADADRIAIIHPGVTPPAGAARTSTRASTPTVATVSRIDDPHKGHAVALEAMVHLRARVPDARWVVIGDGRLRAGLQRRAADLGLGEAVVFTGAVDDAEVDRRLDEAHVFCLLSQLAPAGRAGEGFGIVFIEAGAHGLPVVAGDVPGVRDAVLDGETGLLVDPADAPAAARSLARLLTDPGLARDLGERGRERSRELSWERVARRYRQLIEEAAGRPPRSESVRGLGWLVDLARGPGLPVGAG